MFFRFTPIACNRRIVRLRWLRSALALRCCVNANCDAMDSASRREQRPPRAHSGASVAVAVRIWHTVMCGFFFPVLQTELGQEGVAQTTQLQVSVDRLELAHLEVVHAQFALGVLEDALDGPAAEGHFQQRRHRGVRRGVADEELDLVGIQHVLRHQQVIRPGGQAVRIGQIDEILLKVVDGVKKAA